MRMNSLKSLAKNCDPLSLMIRGVSFGNFSRARCRIDQLVLLGHRPANLPMHDVPAVAVEDRREVVKRAVDVDVADVDMPVFMGFLRLMEARAFLRRLVRRSADAARRLQHAIHAAGADGHHVAVEHHKRQPPIALQRILEREADDRLLLPVFEPPVARHPAVVFVPLAVAILPVVELALADAQPADELPGRNLRALVPTAHVIDHFVAGVVGNPTSVQSSPMDFFARTFSSISSEMTSFF